MRSSKLKECRAIEAKTILAFIFHSCNGGNLMRFRYAGTIIWRWRGLSEKMSIAPEAEGLCRITAYKLLRLRLLEEQTKSCERCAFLNRGKRSSRTLREAFGISATTLKSASGLGSQY
jgi:hypothetical protein